jgi:hypothetical protein
MGYARKGMRVLHLFLAESLYEQALHAGDREVPPVVKTTSISSGSSPASVLFHLYREDMRTGLEI